MRCLTLARVRGKVASVSATLARTGLNLFPGFVRNLSPHCFRRLMRFSQSVQFNLFGAAEILLF